MMEENRYKLQPHMFPKTGEQVEDNSYALGANLNPPPDKVKQVIVVRTDLNMRKGKMIAQGAHASMMFMTKRLEFGLCIVSETRAEIPERALGDFNEDEREWMQDKFTKIAVGVGSKNELLELHRLATEAGLPAHYVEDEGLTEIIPGTVTALAIGPARSSLIDPITGHLKLL